MVGGYSRSPRKLCKSYLWLQVVSVVRNFVVSTHSLFFSIGLNFTDSKVFCFAGCAAAEQDEIDLLLDTLQSSSSAVRESALQVMSRETAH